MPLMADTTLAPAPAVSSARPAAWVAWLMACLSSVAFSLAPVVGKAAIDLGIDPTTLITLRLLITTALLGATLGLLSPQRLRLDRRSGWVCVVSGLAGGVGMLMFFASLTRMEASIASMIFSLSPLVALTLLALRGEKFTYRNSIRLALGVAGVYLLIGPGGQVDWIGVALAFGAVVAAPLQVLFMQWYLQDSDPMAVTFYMVGAMTAAAAGWWLFQGAEWRDPGWQGWLLIGVMAVVSTYLSRLAMFVAVRGIGGGQVSLLAPLETLLTVFWSMLFLGERLAVWQWVGGGLILLSALLAARRMLRARLRQPEAVIEK
jgi:drug/metabolite transporter (DMT)-like permease